jgi:GH15 family glucan-1,4-alpha-glucosidase
MQCCRLLLQKMVKSNDRLTMRKRNQQIIITVTDITWTDGPWTSYIERIRDGCLCLNEDLMSYKPIEDYGVIGNMHTAALVGLDGSIDWFCYPRFDSPSLFAAILDHKKGGHFRISPTEPHTAHKQFYWPDTNVLVTRFLTADGVGQVIDYMPVGFAPGQPGFQWLIRRVQTVRGDMEFRLNCFPAFDYARCKSEVTLSEHGARFTTTELTLDLATQLPLVADSGGVRCEFRLHEGETAVLLLREPDSDGTHSACVTAAEAFEMFTRTVQFWRHWLSQCHYQGRWREAVHRSALVLKLLTYEPTGAIVAAPTCSLPESIGGARNWDYRYTWIRDAAFTLYAFMRLGFTDEAAQFTQFLQRISHDDASGDGPLQIMYGIDGRTDLTEAKLPHLDGYRGSRPVRIGNGAHNQLQLDIYGELMDSIYLYNKYRTPIAYDVWNSLRTVVDWICENWSRADQGIWEVRGGRQHFVYSKLMCWVALDRALRLAVKRSFPADQERWLETRDRIYEEIMSRGWSAQRQAFIQYYGSDALDAANLVMPLVFFVSPTDPRILKTIDAVCRSPRKGGLLSNSLVYRYNASEGIDGLAGDEGTFNMCTFWLVEALTRAGRVYPERLERARLMFEEMLGYANRLGLYGEETCPSGEALGNFPQAFTHLALISAAFNLDRELGGGD